MGTLIAKKYPTKLFLNAADHTYVECGTGARGWSCWGGKTGGTAFNSGAGSTRRADVIAGPDEKAGITCYLVNGVCHQAANRILLPAGILVSAARGYGVSSALFGTYGKTGFWPCSAPFDQHPNSSGDLPECISPDKAVQITPHSALKGEDKYIQSVNQAYAEFDHQKALAPDAIKFHVKLFDQQVKFRLGEDLGGVSKSLLHAKETFELDHNKMIETFANQRMLPAEYIKAFNDRTIRFQDDIAATLNSSQYKKLLDLDRDEKVVLADPDIVNKLYGEGTMFEVYPNLQQRPLAH